MDEGPQWLWPGWIPKGRLSMITGPPGPELTRLAVWLVTSVLRGGPCPDGALAHIESGRDVMWLDTRGEYARLLEHLSPFDFPRERLFWTLDPDKPEETHPAIDLSNDRWLEIVGQHAAHKRPAWVIVDRLRGRHDEIVPEVYRALEVMAAIARDVGSAVTFLYEQDPALAARPGRSAQWAKVAGQLATIMALKRWAPATMDMQFKLSKTIFGDRPDPLRLRFDADMPQVVHRPVTPPRSPVERAVAFLEVELSGGPRSAFEVTDRAWWKNKISPRTLQRAKRQLEVKSYKSAGRWWWILG